MDNKSDGQLIIINAEIEASKKEMKCNRQDSDKK